MLFEARKSSRNKNIKKYVKLSGPRAGHYHHLIGLENPDIAHNRKCLINTLKLLRLKILDKTAHSACTNMILNTWKRGRRTGRLARILGRDDKGVFRTCFTIDISR